MCVCVCVYVSVCVCVCMCVGPLGALGGLHWPAPSFLSTPVARGDSTGSLLALSHVEVLLWLVSLRETLACGWAYAAVEHLQGSARPLRCWLATKPHLTQKMMPLRDWILCVVCVLVATYL